MDDATARLVGARIALLREKSGMSLGDLGEATGTAKSYLSKLEKGESLNVGLATLASVAEALGVTVRDLLPRPGAREESSAIPEGGSSLGATGPESETPANEEVRFEMIIESIPAPLREFLDEESDKGAPVPEDAVRSLAVLKLRGKRPESKDDYRLLYQLLRRLTS